MKIAVTGKGGVGKTTFAATLASVCMQQRGDRYLQQMWIRMRILVLHLGFDEEDAGFYCTDFSKMRKLVEERTGADCRKSVLSSESEGRRYSG